MKIVSQAFLDAQASGKIQYFFTVNMFRRYWDSATSTYKYEETATDLKPYILDKSSIAWQLDTEGLNVWRVSNVTLELKNKYGEFNEGSGKFFNDTYQRYKTKVEIKIGYILADETTETVYNFVGLVIDDPLKNQETDSITIGLSGKEILLTLADGEDVCQTVTGETLGTGALISEFNTVEANVLSVSKVYKNGVEQTLTTHYSVSNLYSKTVGAKITFVTAPALSDIITCDYVYGNNQIKTGEQIGTGALNPDFYTDYKGVGFIDAVYVDGEELGSIDYVINNLNDKDNYAKITFPVGLAIGQTVTCDYRHWYKDVAFETLLGYLLDEAGFPSAERTIGTIDVGSLLKYKIWNTKVEWDAMASLSRNADTATKIGSLCFKDENLVTDITTNVNIAVSGVYPSQSAGVSKMDWTNKYEADALPDASSPAWTKGTAGSPSYEINPAGVLHVTCGLGAQLEYSKAVSTRSMKVRFKITSNTSGGLFQIYMKNGTYTFGVNCMSYGGSLTISGIQGGAWQNVTTPNDYHIVEINAIGTTAIVYIDGAYAFETGNSATASNVVAFYYSQSASATFECYVDYLYDDADQVKYGRITSNGINLGLDTPVYANLGNIIATLSTPVDGSVLTIQTQTSSSPDFSSGNDSWRDVSFTGVVGTISAETSMLRYIRWRAIYYVAVSTSPTLTLMYMPSSILSETVDCGTNLDVYDSLTIFKADNNGLVKIYSQTSADGSSWDAEVEVSGGVIASTKRRYIRFRIAIYLTATGTSPEIYKLYLTYKITSLNVAMGDFTGLTVQDAIEELAKLLDYEIGVDTEGHYFFRAKNEDVSTIDMQLSHKTNIISIDNDSAGWERIYNKIKVAVGNFTSLMSPITLGTAEPHSITKYGLREFSVENASVKVDDDLDLSSGLVKVYYDRYYLPKRNLRLKCKMLPQLELSDTVNINYRTPKWASYWGDPKGYWKKAGLCWFNSEMLPVKDLVSNIVGLELDLTEWVLYISIREI